ncbi:efflux RND transporter permease subunit [Pseudidiomarina insulisalsae]|uniref:Acriflavine resistance protein B n=1 Tax=Pseudidiomarina insulisalsae TaxID=575789 RepID=A0A432YPV8_9GAMM|nr:efflux RND transporter permease subunit [Pseudidiomarina insulisalsae]RUO63160.1 acriflavine resistance protein B [Pseudidiomarina insulisalsae]
MSMFRLSHYNPVATVIAFLIVTLIGFASVSQMPVQLTPNLNRPQIAIINTWRAAAPAELESEIVEPQEEILQGLSGIERLYSSVRAGMSITMLEFAIGTDMQQTFIDVVNALNQTPPRPREAGEPHVMLGGLEESIATLLITQTGEQQSSDFSAYQDLIEASVKPVLQRIDGVARVDLASSVDHQLKIQVDPYKMAALGVQIGTLTNAIQRSANMSGGFAEVGRREYTVRYNGQYNAENYGDMIVAYNEGRPVYLREIATVSEGFADQRSFAYRSGKPAFYIVLNGTNDANTVAVVEDLKVAIADLNEGVLAKKDLKIELSFDPSVHIKRAIDLVQSSIGIGIALVLGLLYWMIRGFRATLLIAVTIPVSLASALLVMSLLGRSLNIISLAGLAFAVGLVLDAAIVVQENFLRLRHQGLSVSDAAIKSAAQVAPALFASTATTVAIFMPVLFMQGLAGQLFYDLAVTMSVAVVMSMLAAMFLIPVLATKLLKNRDEDKEPLALWTQLANLYARLTRTPRRAASWLLFILAGAAIVLMTLTPRPDFLPEAKWEGIFVAMQVPPGANYSVIEDEIAATIVRRLEPYLSGEKLPQVRDYNLSASAGGNVLFVYPQEPDAAPEMIRALRQDVLADLPETMAYAQQASLLNVSVGSTNRAIRLNFNGALDDASRLVIERTIGLLSDRLPNTVLRPVPSIYDAKPELLVTPRDHQLAQAGIDRSTVAANVRAVTNGLWVGELFDGFNRRDIIVEAKPWKTPEALAATPLYTPHAGVQTIGQLADIERMTGPVRIQRLDGSRTLTLMIMPPPTITLDEAVEVTRQVMDEVETELSPGVYMTLSGGADDLSDTITSMTDNFVYAVVILFLIMTAVFRSVKDSLLVLTTVPMALAGGVLGLQLLNVFTFQALDLLTMIGFVILLGLMVNNAILLIDQTRRAQSEGMQIHAAIHYAIATRVRPVYMSSLTSVFGMLPLVLVPGAGSEIYRGLAMVIVGGMLVSTLFMLIYIPAAMRAIAAVQTRVKHFALAQRLKTKESDHVCE